MVVRGAPRLRVALLFAGLGSKSSGGRPGDRGRPSIMRSSTERSAGRCSGGGGVRVRVLPPAWVPRWRVDRVADPVGIRIRYPIKRGRRLAWGVGRLIRGWGVERCGGPRKRGEGVDRAGLGFIGWEEGPLNLCVGTFRAWFAGWITERASGRRGRDRTGRECRRGQGREGTWWAGRVRDCPEGDRFGVEGWRESSGVERGWVGSEARWASYSSRVGNGWGGR